MMTADLTDRDQIVPMFMPALIGCNSFEVRVVTSHWHGSNYEQMASIGLWHEHVAPCLLFYSKISQNLDI